MRILMVNKYLWQKGGAETYVLKLGAQLSAMGHEVEYFGMADARNTVGNSADAYTAGIDFHNVSLKYLTYPFRIIYSRQAAKKIRAVIERFRPDAVHLNNFNYQLTPSIIYEIKRHNIPIVYTAHDVQLVCPNHKLKNGDGGGLCRKCQGGRYINCVKHNCIHSSKLRSIIGAAEAYIYKKLKTYSLIDAVVCPSKFIERELLHNIDIAGKTKTLYNFIEDIKPSGIPREGYVLYFGRYSEEKGIRTLIKAAKALPEIQFVFAGAGELESEIKETANIRDMGFRSGRELRDIIEKAAFTVLPSEWSENCPFTVMESETLLTPVLGADIGGIPELIDEGVTGMLFESGNAEELTEKIAYLHTNKELCRQMSENCARINYDTVETYAKKILKIYSDCLEEN